MKIREENNVPIIIISTGIPDADIVYGLTSGADDYITQAVQSLEHLLPGEITTQEV